MNDRPIKVKLFAIAKDEAAYIPQWVYHHFFFGVDEIEIWLNNIEDNSIKVCESISKVFNNFKYKVVDESLQECIAKGLHFQRYSYNKIFDQELDKDVFTHILYLDLDELWTPKDFNTSIKSLITLYPNADSISFSWYLDDAGYELLPFTTTFKNTQKIYNNKHVKSIVRITNKVEKVNIHNHHIKNGKYILSNGDTFDVDDIRTLEGALTITNGQYNVDKAMDSYFIYHRVFRSQVEYISSLLRGRKHSNVKGIFKDNRWGYKNAGKEYALDIDDSFLREYLKEYVLFIDKTDLLKDLISSQEFIIDRFIKARNIVSSNNELNADIYIKIFKGVRLKYFEKFDSIVFNIDKVFIDEKKHMIIVGWLIRENANPSDLLNIIFLQFKDGKESIIEGELIRIERLDVLRKINNSAPILNGFNFSSNADTEYLFDSEIKIKEFDNETNTVSLIVQKK